MRDVYKDVYNIVSRACDMQEHYGLAQYCGEDL